MPFIHRCICTYIIIIIIIIIYNNGRRWTYRYGKSYNICFDIWSVRIVHTWPFPTKNNVVLRRDTPGKLPLVTKTLQILLLVWWTVLRRDAFLSQHEPYWCLHDFGWSLDLEWTCMEWSNISVFRSLHVSVRPQWSQRLESAAKNNYAKTSPAHGRCKKWFMMHYSMADFWIFHECDLVQGHAGSIKMGHTLWSQENQICTVSCSRIKLMVRLVVPASLHCPMPADRGCQRQKFAPGCKASLGSRLPKHCEPVLPAATLGFHRIRETWPQQVSEQYPVWCVDRENLSKPDDKLWKWQSIYDQKHPGGWETALAVQHFLKKKIWRCGAVRVFRSTLPKFSRGKLSDFEGVMWYLQGFVLLGWCSLFTSALDVSLLQAFA